ncbi:hypothetical protein LUZ60_010681 [Juncus effusus]|nr:hypothetical protein LUZ60_010681 [Juncus effusus]
MKREFTVQCILAFAIVSLIQITTATDYKVGGSNGQWDVGTDLKAWASSKKFYPGDTLTFMYEPFHDLLEVSEVNFERCSTQNFFAFYTGGRTTLDLTSPGTRYFICGVSGHCTSGMKLQVDTLSPSSSSPPPPISSSPPPKPPSPPISNHSLPPTPLPKQNNTSPPPKRSPSYPPKLAPKVSPKPSPSKYQEPVMAPAPVPSASMVVGVDRILNVVLWGIVLMVVMV